MDHNQLLNKLAELQWHIHQLMDEPDRTYWINILTEIKEKLIENQNR